MINYNVIFENQFLSIHELDNFFYIGQRTQQVLIACTIGEDFLMVHQFRNPLVGTTLEFPGGGVESIDKNIFDTISRELREETGILLGNSPVSELSSIIACPNRIPIPVRLFWVDLNEHSFKTREDLCHETSLIEIITNDQLHSKILTGKLCCAGTLAALSILQAFRKS